MPSQERIEYLFQRYLTRMETPEELEELMDVIENGDQKAAIEQLFEKAQQGIDRTVRLNDEQTERLFQVISLQSGVAPIIQMTRWRKWRQVSVAAAIVLGLSVGGYFMFFHGNRTPATEVATVQPVKRDVEAPKASRATITLADGRTVSLDSLTAITQNNVQLTKTADGKIVYSGNAGAMVYNTLTNPRGSQAIDITLSDGSKVWLNAGSAVTYPVAFMGSERKVAITGEAYFEVAHDKTKPFYVSKGDMQVQVLGTHFNVNAYDDEAAIKVTLLQGSVLVKQSAPNSYVDGNKHSAILKPGEQAITTNHSPFTIYHSPDLEQVMAWKDGLFNFNKVSLQEVMHQLARWYNVEVEYQGAVTNKTLGGEMQRDLSLSEVLDGLKNLGVHARIVGKKVIVIP